MKSLGTIARLQVQTATLKRESGTRDWYDPAPIRTLPACTLDAGGLSWEEDGVPMLDIHHTRHPSGKGKGTNAVSVGFTGYYGSMRARFGPHLTDGIAGENVLLAYSGRFSVDDLAAGLIIQTESGSIHLHSGRVAEPCVEYTRFALQYPLHRPSDRAVSEALQFLRDGMRGFYFSYSGHPVVLTPGMEVLRP